MLHSQAEIRTILKVSKSIYSIHRLEDYTIETGHGEIHAMRARMSGLEFRAGEPYVSDFSAVLPKNVLDEINEKHSDMRFFVNGVVSEFRRPNVQKFHTLNSVAFFGTSSQEMYQSLIGLVCVQAFSSNDSMSYVGKVSAIKEQVKKIITTLSGSVNYPISIGDSLPDLLQKSMDWLAPIFVYDEERVFYCHPAFMSALYACGVAPDINEDQTAMLQALKLFQRGRTIAGDELEESPEADIVAERGYSVCPRAKSNSVCPRNVWVTWLTG